jgi:oxygen-dependent protoporphyrinogen oxidase
VAGLAAAARLREIAGDAAEIILIEGADRLGGKIRTDSLAGLVAEAGAETFLMSERGGESAVLELARTVGLGAELVHPAPVPASVAVGARLRPIPPGTLLGVPVRPSTVEGIADVVDTDRDEGRPLLAPGGDITVGDLVRSRFGDAVVDRLVDPMLGGVYAGSADTLSLAATLPGVHAAALTRHTLTDAVATAVAAAPRPTGAPVFASVRGGLGRLIDAVAQAARARVLLGTVARDLTRTPSGWRITVGGEVIEADAVVLAVPAPAAARLLTGVDAAAADLVGRLDYASVALVTLALPAGTELPDISGFLVPAVEGYAVKAATFFTTKWPYLREAWAGGTAEPAPVLVRASFGRYGESAVLDRSDDELAALARAEVGRLIGRDLPRPLTASVTRWEASLPQYGVGHVDRVAEVRRRLPASLAVAGAAYDGVGIAACVRSGRTAADTAHAASHPAPRSARS